MDDDELIVSMLTRSLKKEGHEVKAYTSGKDIIDKILDWHPHIVMLDIMLGEDKDGLDILQDIKKEKIDTEIVMLTSDDTAETAIKAMKLGAVDYLTKPFNIDEIKIVIANTLANSRLKEELEYLKRNEFHSAEEIIGRSAVMRDMIEQAETLALAGTSNLLVTGESGTGKEVMSRFFHKKRYLNEYSSKAAAPPFIALNCTTLAQNLIESELFGHTRGAFTDAKTDKKGVFEMAHGGTLLLDEIGEMRPDVQAKFLRVLETRTVRRLGGKEDLTFEEVVIAATNKDLEQEVRNGNFREDLYYRLNTFVLHLPPLRERKEDIPMLAGYFLNSFSQQYQKKNIKGFSKEAEKLLSSYSWPGNVRELRNVVERCVVLERGEYIGTGHLPTEVSGRPITERRKNFEVVLPDKGVKLDEVVKELVRQAMNKTNHNKKKAAKLLGITYDTLRYQVKKFELE